MSVLSPLQHLISFYFLSNTIFKNDPGTHHPYQWEMEPLMNLCRVILLANVTTRSVLRMYSRNDRHLPVGQ